jgi:hypothetical protein
MSALRRAGRETWEVLPAWITARLLVLVAFAAATLAADHLTPGQPHPIALRQGLFAWDGDFYRSIARHGYPALPREAARFFPLYPLTGRLLSFAVAGSATVALVVTANVAALAATVLVARLARRELGAAEAIGSAWWFSLYPAAFVFVLAYAEALFLALTLAALLALRARRWWWAALFAFLAALTRPLGAAIAVAAVVEVGRQWGRAHRTERAARIVAVAAPLAGLGAFLLYAAVRLPGGWLAPVHEQSALRGHTVEPVGRILRAVGDLTHARTLADGFHAPFAIALVVLVVLSFRWLPASLAAYSAVVVALSLSADNLNSLERYGLNAVPLVIVLASAARRTRLDRPALLVSAGLFTTLCLLAFVGAYVP